MVFKSRLLRGSRDPLGDPRPKSTSAVASIARGFEVLMAEKDVRFVSVQQDSGGIFKVAIPLREVAQVLKLRKHQRLKVILDQEKCRIIYELID